MVKTKWSDISRVIEESEKYSTRTDFAKFSPTAYQEASDNNWLSDERIKLPDRRCGPNWTRERILAKAKKCSGRKEFRNVYNKAYKAASRQGLLPEIYLMCGWN